jgi:cysteine sulfinate desulfinase/cysteine desulfurase-like protein
MGLSPQDSAASVRFSIGRFTATSEIVAAVELIQEAVIDAENEAA